VGTLRHLFGFVVDASKKKDDEGKFDLFYFLDVNENKLKRIKNQRNCRSV
jgi:hypothetical protein